MSDPRAKDLELLKNMEKDPLYQEILKLPKTDLHCHLDGSLRLDTIVDLIKRQGMPYPIDREKLRSLVVKDDPEFLKNRSLVEYLKAFAITTSVMQDAESIERIAFELAEDAAAENVRYLEVRFAPILHTNRGMTLNEITAAVSAGLARAEKQYEIACGIIICGMRHYVPCGIEDNLLRSLPHATPDDAAVLMAIQTARHAVEMAQKDHHVVAFDLAGGEVDNPAPRYKHAFYAATNGLVPTTVHAGEAVGPESILESVHFLHVKRIGHGTNLYKNPILMNYFKNERIPLEVCVTSNLQTNQELHAYSDHPLRIYIENRLRTTICTDNRLVSNTTVTKELYLIAKTFGLDMDRVKVLIGHGFNSAMHNCYFPKSNNAYDGFKRIRTKAEREMGYDESLSRVVEARKE